MKNKFYITTPIYYPSAKLHIGHAYCTTLCDVYARFRREQGYETYFLTGADEHGLKIERNAEAAGLSPQEFVDGIILNFKELWKKLHITNDDFIRTTEQRHIKTVQTLFSNMLKRGDIYLGKYQGWYCPHEEAFWTDTQVGPEHLCPECHRPVEKAKEETYFFKTGKYVDRLMKYYDDHPNFITPVSRKNEMINTFIKPGLEDLSVSRTSFSWGVPVKENPKHVVYVWLDALSNYISALGYLNTDNPELFKKFWEDESTEIIHVVGADITRFHAIYWPMFLMSEGLRLPDREFVHGLLMMKDGKMSKSRGNVIDPIPLIERYGVDAVRYYLARETVFGSDGTFTPEQFIERTNVDLANDFGNLLHRTISMINKYFDGEIPSYQGTVTPFDQDLENLAAKTVLDFEKKMGNLEITEAIVSVFTLISAGNKYIDNTEPWNLKKNGQIAELQSVMNHLANVLFKTALLLKPVLVEAPNKLFDQLGVAQEKRQYQNVYTFAVLGGETVQKGAPLFPRLDSAVEVPYITGLMQGK
ncbi:MAG: methionine--tRNA ligase [Bacilli bacterium]|jgi:methionyl-tRNA synthetase